jgi:hypothetical protein
MSLDEMTAKNVCWEMTANDMSVDENIVHNIFIDKETADKISSDEIIINEMSVDEIALD